MESLVTNGATPVSVIPGRVPSLRLKSKAGLLKQASPVRKVRNRMTHKGLRFNTGKTKHELVPAFAQEQYARVLTRGAEKYGKGNWEKGMPWTTVIASLKRHLNAIEAGEDFDKETGEYHAAHLMCNAAFLMEYYKLYPQGDDRSHWFKKPIKSVYLDIDGVIAAFEEHFLEWFGYEGIHANDWNDPIFRRKFDEISNNEKFWSSLPALETPHSITYPIAGYCTSRSIPIEMTQRWLDNQRFPTGKLISLKLGESKVAALKEAGCEFFIDDSIKNFIELQSNGINCFLKTRPHNEKYEVGHFRVNNLTEFFDKIKAMS